MRQMSFAEAGFDRFRKKTRRRRFLEEMDRVVPWDALCAAIAPVYPKRGRGRPPVELERMLRIYFLQQWFDLSDPGVEEALYESDSMRRFVGIDLGRERAPDETTVCKFRHLLERHDLTEAMFEQVQEYLAEHGVRVRNGTIVDATILTAPSSRKNRAKARDPEMGSTRKGQQWYFGMKAHIGMDSQTKQIHSVVATAANVHDSQVLAELLHGGETRVWGDKAYCGQRKVIREVAPRAQDFTQRKAFRNQPLTEQQRAANVRKARVRARVEHPFQVMKRVFGFREVRYRGIEKNWHRVVATCALVNLFQARRVVIRAQERCAC